MSRPAGEHLRNAVLAAAAAVVALSLVLLLRDLSAITAPVWALGAVFLATIAVGEAWQLRSGMRETSPVALAASLAFAMVYRLPEGELVRRASFLVVIVVAVGTALGIWLRHRAGRRQLPAVAATDVALRVLVVGAVVLVYRLVPFGDGTLRDHVVSYPGSRWLVALLLLALAGAAVTAKLALTVLLRAGRDHEPVLKAFAQELGAVGPLALSVVTTATVVTLAVEPLGAIAVPLFMAPLVLLQLAVRRQLEGRSALRETVRALSRLTELGGRTPPGHAARVALLAVPVGRELGLSDRELTDLEYAALLHDIGQVSLDRPIPGGATTETATFDQRQIAVMGAAILSRTAELSRLSMVVAQQATPYRRTQEVGEISAQCRVIKVCNAFDDIVGAATGREAVLAGLDRIRLGVGYEYDPEAVTALVRVLTRQGRLSPADRSRLAV